MRQNLKSIRKEIIGFLKNKRFGSWSYFIPACPVTPDLCASPEKYGEKIWNTQSSTVWKIPIPGQNGRYAVYKAMRSKPREKLRYLFDRTPVFLEAVNYLMLERAGLSVAKFFGVGEKRKCGLIQNSFFMTEFADGYQDGRVLAAEAEGGEHPYLDEFIRKSLEGLAGMHDLNFLHRGFKIYNILWKKENPRTPMQMVWIDIATGKLVSASKLAGSAAKDIGDLFEYFGMPPERLALYVEHYCRCRTQNAPDPAEETARVLAYQESRRKLYEAKHSGLRLKWRRFRKKHKI